MSDPGSYVNTKLQTTVPWGDLLTTSNLQTILHAIVQRLDRQESLIGSSLASQPSSSSLKYSVRLEDIELMSFLAGALAFHVEGLFIELSLHV
jgi:hypothetical protein